MATLHFGSGQPLVPTVAASCREVIKGTFINPNLVQLREEGAQKLFAKPGSDSASKFKLLTLVKADEQRAEIFPRAFGFGVSADDELLLQMQLDLDPCSAAFSGLIPGTGAFTNQPFQSECPSPVQKLWNIFCEGGRISENTRRLFQQFFQLCLPFFDR